MSRRAGAVALGALGLAACGGGDADAPSGDGPAPWFTVDDGASGMRFEHRSGSSGDFYLPEVVCGGVALLDADDDGRLDVYFVQAGRLQGDGERPGNELYRNLGARRFEDVSATSGADDRGYGMGVAAGDYDDDGRTDLYVTNVGPNALLRNRGACAFEDATAAAGVGHPGLGSSAAFFDADLDGDLDLFVANYLVWSPATERECFNALGRRDYCAPARYDAPAPAVLYRNDGDGAFTDVSAESGVAAAPSTGLGVVCADFTGDDLPDVFVANDGLVDHLWVGVGEGRFEERGRRLGCALDQDGVPKAGMGVAVGDVDDDGDLDLLVCNLRGERDSGFVNEGTYFADATAAWGLGTTSRTFTRFGTGWFDLDDDGFLDLYQANGRIATDADGHGTGDPLAEPNLLFRGTGGGRFAEVLPRGGVGAPVVLTSRGAAFGDLDGDGGVDVVVVNRDAPATLLWNAVAGRGHWLSVRVRDRDGADALGARVTLRLGQRTLRRDVRSAHGYLSASDPRAHFGLGTVRQVDALEVRWPDGEVTRHAPDGVDRTVEVRR